MFSSLRSRAASRLHYQKNYFENNIKAYLPEAITVILMNYFSLGRNSFLEDESEIPPKVFSLGREHIFAFLTGIIIDEGHVGSGQISIGLNNEKLIRQLSEICRLLGYKHSVKPRKPAGHNLYILSGGLEKFWEDYSLLKKEFPEADMGYKENALMENIKRTHKNWKSRGHNQTKNLIIGTLMASPKTANELASLLGITRQGTRHQLRQLEAKGIIARKYGAKYGAYTYELAKYEGLPESAKGSSRAISRTNSKIKELLKKSPMSTIELAARIRMGKDSIRNQLYLLESKNEIERAGLRKMVTHPSTLWRIAANQG